MEEFAGNFGQCVKECADIFLGIGCYWIVFELI